MNLVYKMSFFLMTSLCVFPLQGAIGCKKIEHTVNYWNASKPQYVSCSCPCNNVAPDYRGQCMQCGHFGRPDRGAISRRVLADQGIAYN